MLTEKAMQLILAERQRQDAKWGVQRHEPVTWMLIAIEEIGEVSQALLHRDRPGYLIELVQTAAVLVAWLESELARDDGQKRLPGLDDESET